MINITPTNLGWRVSALLFSSLTALLLLLLTCWNIFNQFQKLFPSNFPPQILKRFQCYVYHHQHYHNHHHHHYQNQKQHLALISGHRRKRNIGSGLRSLHHQPNLAILFSLILYFLLNLFFYLRSLHHHQPNLAILFSGFGHFDIVLLCK